MLVRHCFVTYSSEPSSPYKTRGMPLESCKSVGVPIKVGFTYAVEYAQRGTCLHTLVLVRHCLVANSSEPSSTYKTRVTTLESPESADVPTEVCLSKIVEYNQGGTCYHVLL